MLFKVFCHAKHYDIVKIDSELFIFSKRLFAIPKRRLFNPFTPGNTLPVVLLSVVWIVLSMFAS